MRPKCYVCGKLHDALWTLYRCASCGTVECRPRLHVSEDSLKHVEEGDGLCGPVYALKAWPVLETSMEGMNV